MDSNNPKQLGKIDFKISAEELKKKKIQFDEETSLLNSLQIFLSVILRNEKYSIRDIADISDGPFNYKDLEFQHLKIWNFQPMLVN